MKRLHAWLAGLAGGAAVYRAFRRTPQPRPAAPDRDEFETGETSIDSAPDPDVASRRRSVHEQARAAIDEMRPAEQPGEQPR